MTVFLGLDPGTRRVGLAVSDADGRIAFPVRVVERKAGWIEEVVAEARERGAEEVVVGLPVRMDGAEGPAAAQARSLAEEVRKALGLPVRMADERLTSSKAERDMAASGVGSRRRRKIVDASAAALILQSYLDGRRPG